MQIPHALIEYLSTPAPRYTSYPSAQHFIERVEEETFTHWLTELNAQERLALYLHIPFCAKLCWFCGCHTKATQRYAPVEKYLHYLRTELQLLGKMEIRAPIHTLHLGGGSPTILAEEDLLALMTLLNAHFTFADSAEIAIEIDPRNFSDTKAETYQRIGVNRASLGVQDINPEVQSKINREQPWELVEKSYENLRAIGVEEINLDIVYGLPGQTRAGLANTVDAVLSLRPSRVALFSYAHVPWIKKHQRLIAPEELPSVEEKYHMYREAEARFLASGYVAIGLDHFALPQDSLAKAYAKQTMQRNFMGYVAGQAQHILGAGVSSISQCEQGYAQNHTTHAEYERALTAGHLPLMRGYHMTAEDRIRKHIIDRLMCYLAVDLAEIRKTYHLPDTAFKKEQERLTPWLTRGVVTLENETIALVPEYKMLVRIIASLFDTHMDPEQFKYSKVV